jgi:hypothetical protein
MAFVPLGTGRAMLASGTLRRIKMNTLEPLLTDDRESLKVDRTLISRASRRTRVRSSIPVARKKHWQLRLLISLLPLWAIALIVYRLRAVPADSIRQEFEGLEAALCVAACGGVLIWRVTHAIVIEQKLQAQPPIENQAPVSSSEPDLSNPRKIQSSLPPDAATASAAPVAPLSTETRT